MSYDMHKKVNILQQTLYNTFPVGKNIHNQTSIMQSCMITFVIGLLLIQLLINAIGLHIGVTYNNATCYEDKFAISLSLWLIVTTSVAVTSTCLQLIVSLIQYFCGNEKTLIYSSISYAIYTVIISLYYFVMTIIGIIELSYQFTLCHKEVQYVTVMTIIIVVVNLLSILSVCTIKTG